MQISGIGHSKMTGKTKIFVIYHKPENPIKSDVFQPICVGPNKDQFSNDFLRDDVGENIADKNSIYNELTAIYWVYKNIEQFKGVEYFGFSHYRRLFCFNGLNKTAYVKKHNDTKLTDVTENTIKTIFKDFDFIAPLPSHYRSVQRHYEKSHNKEDLKVLLNVIEEDKPDYIEDAKSYLTSKDEYLYNMFIFKRDDFLRYCEFIFDISARFLKKTKTKNRFYISERLTGIFINHLYNEGKESLKLPILHIRTKSFKSSHKQTKTNLKNNSDNGKFYKIKPILLYLVPRSIEQCLRRRKCR